MKQVLNRHGAGRVAGKVASDVVESMAKDAAKGALKQLPEFCRRVAEQGWPCAAAAFAGCVPVIGSALALGGIALYKHRKDQKNDADERSHYRALAEALGDIAHDQKQAIEKLTTLCEQRPFVWTEVTTEDPGAAAAQVTAAFQEAGFDGTVTMRDLLGVIQAVGKKVVAVKEDTEAIRREQLTKDDLAAALADQKSELVKIFTLYVESTKLFSTADISEGSRQISPPPEDALAEARRVVREYGHNQIELARARMLLSEHAEADAMLSPLSNLEMSPETRFRYLTLLGDNWYLADEPDKAVGPYEQALALRPDDFTARNNATIAHTFARLGDIAAHRHRAIQIADHTLTLLDPKSTEWATTQHRLGTAWSDLPTGDRADNIRHAIACLEAALTVRTIAAHAADWAATQNNLGIAWSGLPTGDRADNIRHAIACYEAALTVYTWAAHPVYWATTQHNLGTVWQDMPIGDRADNLHRAIACYEAALTVRTKDAHPADWAHTQNNLGNAWSNLPTGDRTDNLRRAIDTYQQTLTVYTKAAHPVGWAATQNNLAVAWADLPTGDRGDNLHHAIACYESTLTVYTKATHPARWAATRYNLGLAWKSMPTGDRADNIRRAIACFEAALTVRTIAAYPADWAGTQLTLGNAWIFMPTGDQADNIRRAIEAYEAALTVYTEATHPEVRAQTQYNLGIAWGLWSLLPE